MPRMRWPSIRPLPTAPWAISVRSGGIPMVPRLVIVEIYARAFGRDVLTRVLHKRSQRSVALTGQKSSQFLPGAVALCLETKGLQLVRPGVQDFDEGF